MKTAIEWLLFELSKNGLLPDGIPMNVHNKAKEMEKQQMKDAWLNGSSSIRAKNAEQYYNETFKTK